MSSENVAVQPVRNVDGATDSAMLVTRGRQSGGGAVSPASPGPLEVAPLDGPREITPRQPAHFPWLERTLLSRVHDMGPVREAVRRLHLTIQAAAEQEPIQYLLIASTQSGEGRSTLAANLALLLGEIGRRVLLIDAHLGPTVPRGVSLLALDENAAGLGDYLAGHVELGAIVQPGPMSHVQVITAGRPGVRPGLLESDLLTDLVAQCQDSYDAVIVDGPPYHGSADALVLAGVADAIVLVARMGMPVAGIVAVHRGFQQVGARVIGVVLTETSIGRLPSTHPTRGSHTRVRASTTSSTESR